MIYPFTKNHSQVINRVVTLTAAALVLTTALTACTSKSLSTPSTDDTTPISLLETTTEDTAAPATEETTEATEAPKKNVAIVKEQLNVRSSPSTESNIISTLDAGEEVEINRIETVNYVQWAYIPLKGWVTTENLDMSNIEGIVPTSTPAQATEPAEKPEETTGAATTTTTAKKGTITATELNIRKEPAKTSTIVGKLKKGDTVTILETSNGWGKITNGWISMDYVDLTGATTAAATTTTTTTASVASKNTNNGKTNALVTGTVLNVRSGAGTNYNTVGHLTQGDRIYVQETTTTDGTTWGKINSGWICMDYVYKDGDTGTGSGTGTVTGTGVNIRSGPGTKYNVVSSANKGDTVKVLAQYTVGNTKWGCLSNGWICMDYVKMN